MSEEGESRERFIDRYLDLQAENARLAGELAATRARSRPVPIDIIEPSAADVDAVWAENKRLAEELAALRLENESLVKQVVKSHRSENRARAELHQVQATDALWFLDPNSRESLHLALRRAGETIDWYDQEFARLEAELQRVKAAARRAIDLLQAQQRINAHQGTYSLPLDRVVVELEQAVSEEA